MEEELVEGSAATRAVPAQPGNAQQAVPDIEQLLRREGQVLEAVHHRPPHFSIARVTVVVPDQIRCHFAAGARRDDAIIDLGIEAQQENIEVPAVRRAHGLGHKPRERLVVGRHAAARSSAATATPATGHRVK